MSAFDVGKVRVQASRPEGLEVACEFFLHRVA